MPDKEKDWDLNVVVTDPKDPEGLDGKTYGMISGGRKIQVGDTLPEGVVEGFVDRGVRILPDTGPEYTVKMGDHRRKNQTPRAQARENAAETALQKAAKKSMAIQPSRDLDIDPPTEEELEDMESGTYDAYPPLSLEEEMEYPEDLRHPAVREAMQTGEDYPDPDFIPVDEREDYEQEDTGDVDYIPYGMGG